MVGWVLPRGCELVAVYLQCFAGCLSAGMLCTTSNSTTGIISGAIDLDDPLRDVPDRGERVDIQYLAGHLRT